MRLWRNPSSGGYQKGSKDKRVRQYYMLEPCSDVQVPQRRPLVRLGLQILKPSAPHLESRIWFVEPVTQFSHDMPKPSSLTSGCVTTYPFA